MSKNLEDSLKRVIDSLQECIDGLQKGDGNSGHRYNMTRRGTESLGCVEAIQLFGGGDGNALNIDECVDFVGGGDLLRNSNGYVLEFEYMGARKTAHPGDYIVKVGPLTLVLNQGEFGFLFEAADA